MHHSSPSIRYEYGVLSVRSDNLSALHRHKKVTIDDDVFEVDMYIEPVKSNIIALDNTYLYILPPHYPVFDNL